MSAGLRSPQPYEPSSRRRAAEALAVVGHFARAVELWPYPEDLRALAPSERSPRRAPPRRASPILRRVAELLRRQENGESVDWSGISEDVRRYERHQGPKKRRVEGEKRGVNLSVRFTRRDFERIQRHAEESGRSTSETIRLLSLKSLKDY